MKNKSDLPLALLTIFGLGLLIGMSWLLIPGGVMGILVCLIDGEDPMFLLRAKGENPIAVMIFSILSAIIGFVLVVISGFAGVIALTYRSLTAERRSNGANEEASGKPPD